MEKGIKGFDKKLKKYIDNKEIVKIYRTVTDGEANIFGFILEVSNQFLLIQNENDFTLDGYSIIKKNHFHSVRCNKLEKTTKRILKSEGITKADYGINKVIGLDNWKSVFEDLKRNDCHVIVECEDLKEPLFLIGEIVKISKKSVNILYYDAEGVFDSKPTKVRFKDITLVKFDDRYSTIFRKYLK